MVKLIKEYEILQTKINKLELLNKPIGDNLRLRQMEILQTLDDEFVKSNQENVAVYTVRIRYNSMLKFLAEKLNLPVDKYVANIKSLSEKMGI